MPRRNRTCDGMVRRDALKVGVLGAGGLTLGQYLRAAEAAETPGAPMRSAIFIDLAGGPTHIDTFDPKPEAPEEIRGKFAPIKTNVPGIEISEHLPKLAQCADKYAIVRGVSHTLAAHRLGSEYINTGNRPLASLEYPGYGAVVTKESEGTNPNDLPPFVSIPSGGQRPGFLGVKYGPLNTNRTPQAGNPFSVRGVTMQGGMTLSEFENRHKLLKDLDSTFASLDRQSQLIEGLDDFNRKAFNMITSSKAREAFDISKETPSFAEPFGDQPFGTSCLLAVRLIESGVRFVTLRLGGWDTHQNNFERLQDNLLPNLDTGLSALLVGLEQKGLLDSTAVYVSGEFGRTPKINQRGAQPGRDHYPRCMFMLMAGGDVKGGQVVGESDEKAAGPKNDGFAPDDVAATFYRNIGVDFTKEYHTDTGRPITIVRNGTVIDSLIS
jgi:hypothetical protein